MTPSPQSRVFFRFFSVTALSILCLAGGQEVGNGGDPLYLIMQKARVDAVTMVKSFTSSDPSRPEVQAQFSGPVWAFLWSSYQGQVVASAIAEDIKTSPHEFLDDSGHSTCARTNLPDRAARTILFSLTDCRLLLESRGEEIAVQLLLHEAVHHFGIGVSTEDEILPTDVALELERFWQRHQQENAPHWQALTMQDGPEARYQATTVALDGESFFVWGGCNGSTLPLQESCERFLNNGKLFRFAGNTGTWLDVTSAGAPKGRKLATSVYTGDQSSAAMDRRVIVWGGCKGPNAGCTQPLNDGGIYDTVHDEWQPMPATEAPGRTRHSAVWTGKSMLVYGGLATSTTAPYKRALGDLWILEAAPNKGWQWRQVQTPGWISARFGQSSVWTGDKLLVFGGCAKPGNFSCQQPLNDAFTFDPVTSRFETLTAPPAGTEGRLYASAVWTGSHAIFWGGLQGANTPSDDGVILDLTSAGGRWTPIDALLPSGEDGGRYFHQATWTGDSMIVYGGVTRDGSFPNTALQFRYLVNNPSQQSWRIIDTPTNPISRKEHSQVWTDAGLVIWGGYGARNTFLPTGAVLRQVQ